jgi:hypothetical protein
LLKPMVIFRLLSLARATSAFIGQLLSADAE